MSKAFYVMEMWQTGNIGGYNIRKVSEQPKEGFLIYRDAETWLAENIERITQLWETFVILMVYEKDKKTKA